jgi:hypothetical protein
MLVAQSSSSPSCWYVNWWISHTVCSASQVLPSACRYEAIGQCRTQPGRVRGLRQVSVRVDPQCFFLDPPEAAGKRVTGFCSQSVESLVK